MAHRHFQAGSGEPISSDRSYLSNAFSETLQDCMTGPDLPIRRTASPVLQPTPASRQMTHLQPSAAGMHTPDSHVNAGNPSQRTYSPSATAGYHPSDPQSMSTDPHQERQRLPKWLQRRRDRALLEEGDSAYRQQQNAYPPSFLRPSSRSMQREGEQQEQQQNAYPPSFLRPSSRSMQREDEQQQEQDQRQRQHGDQQQQQQQHAENELALPSADPASDAFHEHQADLLEREVELNAAPQSEQSVQQPPHHDQLQQPQPQRQHQSDRQTSEGVSNDTGHGAELEGGEDMQQYLSGCPAAFRACADVVLLLGGRRLMVHSQILASQSTFFANMWTGVLTNALTLLIPHCQDRMQSEGIIGLSWFGTAVLLLEE